MVSIADCKFFVSDKRDVQSRMQCTYDITKMIEPVTTLRMSDRGNICQLPRSAGCGVPSSARFHHYPKPPASDYTRNIHSAEVIQWISDALCIIYQPPVLPQS